MTPRRLAIAALVALFVPQLLPDLFAAEPLPPAAWLAFAIMMVPVALLFRRLSVEQGSILAPFRPLVEPY